MNEQKSKQPRKVVPYEDFEKKIFEREWSINADNFSDYINRKREEWNLFLTAVDGGPRWVEFLAYHECKCSEITARNQLLQSQRYEERLKVCDGLIEEAFFTGDVEFDAFRLKLRGHDWHYDYSDDIRVWRAGNESQKVIEKIVAEKGGIYATAYEHERKKRYAQQG